jgi:hypothetical protein
MPYQQARPALSPEDAWKKRVRFFGIFMLVSALAYLFLCVIRIASQLVMGPLLQVYFTWLESMAPAVKLSRMMGPMMTFMEKIAVWEILRTVPFAIAAGWLIFIARRLMRSERLALRTIRTWCLATVGPIAMSIAIQLIFVVPATLAYTAAITKTMPSTAPAGTPGGPPFDVSIFMSSMTNAATGVGIVLGAITIALFPIGVYIWSSKLDKDAPA